MPRLERFKVEPEQDRPLAYVELLKTYRERFQLALSFLRPATRKVVVELWKIMLEDDDSLRDREVAALISERTGCKVSAEAVPRYRRRLRQKMEVFLFFDLHPPDRDPRDDKAVLDWIEQSKGVAPGDVPTLRALAALCRAGWGESLGWALLARSLILDPESRGWAQGKARDLLRAGQTARGLAIQRIALYLRWLEGDLRGVFKNLRRLAREGQAEFLLPAGWMSVVFRRRSAREAFSTLFPGGSGTWRDTPCPECALPREEVSECARKGCGLNEWRLADRILEEVAAADSTVSKKEARR